MKAGEVRVRAARLEDLGAVAALERGVEEAPHWAEREYAAIVSGGEGELVRRCLLVAERGDSLVGFAVGKVIGVGETAGGELESVAVTADARRLGAGRALCEGVVVWCRAEGAAQVELEVRSANRSARCLYESMGFTVVGVRKGYYREPADDAVLMRLGLAAR